MFQVLRYFSGREISNRASLVNISDDPTRAPHFSSELLGRIQYIIEKLLSLNTVFLIFPVDIVLNLLQLAQLVNTAHIRQLVWCVQFERSILHDIPIYLPHFRWRHLLKLRVVVDPQITLLRGTTVGTLSIGF